jgi:uncharacterized membrane protein YccC
MPNWHEKLTYCIANMAAVYAALWIAFRLDLQRPYWAVFTVFIVSKPISGAVRAKGVYRLIGTFIGAAMAVFLVPPLVQSPVLLSLAVSAWVGLCLFFALLDRTPRTYAFLLAGYSVTIVGLAVVNNPTTVFDVAVSRVEEISIGIICAVLAHSVFFPRNFGNILRSKAEGSLAKSAQAAADALGPSPKKPSTRQIAACAGVVTELHTLYAQIGYETSNVRRVPTVMAGLLDRISTMLPKASLMANALLKRQAIGPVSDSVRVTLDETTALLTAFAQGKKVAADEVLADLEALSEMLDEEESSESVSLELLVVHHAAGVLRALHEGKVLAAALTDAEAAKGITALLPTNTNRPLYRDKGLALLSAAAAAGATLFACWLWIWNAWPEGFVAAQFAAICTSLFATFDRPSKVIVIAVVAIIVALPVAAVYEFAILPQMDGFASLALALSPMLIFFSVLQTNERLEAPALLLSVGFFGALAIQETFVSDFASFVNSNLAEICGPLIAIAMLLVFRTIDPAWNARRIIRSAWHSIGRLAYAAPKNPGAWVLHMFDRMGLAAARLDPATAGAAERDLLRDFRVGLNILTLQQLKGELASTVRGKVQEAIASLCEFYEDTVSISANMPPPAVAKKLEALASALSGLPQSEDRLEGLVAVNGLRLDLDAAWQGATP